MPRSGGTGKTGPPATTAWPAGLSFADNHDGTATLAGTPTQTGTFSLMMHAANGVGPDASQGFTLTVSAPSAVAVTPSGPSTPAGSTLQFTASATFPDGSHIVTATVNWTSSNTSVATISSGGLANALRKGKATITATLAGAGGKTSLTVTAPLLTGITVTPATLTLAVGKKQQFTATGSYSDGSTANVTSRVVSAFS